MRPPPESLKKWGSPSPQQISDDTTQEEPVLCCRFVWMVAAAAKSLHNLHIQLHWSLWLTRPICFPAVHHLISETAEFLLIGDSVIKFKWSFRVELPVFLANLDFGHSMTRGMFSTLLLYTSITDIKRRPSRKLQQSFELVQTLWRWLWQQNFSLAAGYSFINHFNCFCKEGSLWKW